MARCSHPCQLHSHEGMPCLLLLDLLLWNHLQDPCRVWGGFPESQQHRSTRYLPAAVARVASAHVLWYVHFLLACEAIEGWSLQEGGLARTELLHISQVPNWREFDAGIDLDQLVLYLKAQLAGFLLSPLQSYLHLVGALGLEVSTTSN
jgi:hypothetical protein